MDDNFTMEPHINNIMRVAFFKIREISYYRRFLTPSCAKNIRVQFKLLLQAYKALHGLAPSYLSSKLPLRPNKGLRSDNQLLLDVPKATLQLKYYGDRAFSVAGPTL